MPASAVLRRYQPVKTEEVIPDLKCVKYEDLVINLSNYSVIYKGQAVDMPKELELYISLLLPKSGFHQRTALRPYLNMNTSVIQERWMSM